MINYIGYFFIYAIIGWMLEVSFHVITQGKFINRGFLSGPYCPIYGFGALGVILALNKVDEVNKFTLFFASMIIATLLELITGFLLEKIFHKRWWDYSNNKFNLGGYICAEFSLLWGAVCFILYEAVHPLVVKLVGIIPYKILLFINIGLSLLFIVDFISTVITLLGLNQKFKTLSSQSQDIKRLSDELGQRVADRTAAAIELGKEIEQSPRFKEFDQRSEQFKEKFDKASERRILRAYPNLINGLEDKWQKDFKKERK